MFIVSSCASIEKELGVPEDNVVEEMAEEVIEHHLYINIDLTPKSPE